MRALRKKLRGIEEVEALRAAGKELSPEQAAKLATRAAVAAELAAAEARLPAEQPPPPPDEA